ncbi:hypothetical protein THL1_6013 (plasmid) [Pseudomonas sp. TCU-HL1]|nr:hypothetical protein THL1_6013 [Pseudomonas sp. TCU-HL1]
MRNVKLLSRSIGAAAAVGVLSIQSAQAAWTPASPLP